MTRRVVWLLALSVVLVVGSQTVPLFSQVHSPSDRKPANREAVERQLIGRERLHVQAFGRSVDVSAEMKTAMQNHNPDSVAITANGIWRAKDLPQQLQQIKAESSTMGKPEVIWLTPEVAVVAYEWTGKATYAGKPLPDKMYMSTTWVKRGKMWRPVVRQFSGDRQYTAPSR